ncbi:ethanolamine ammonia-lyase small subunit [Stappia sp. 22II-S9-Z10]|nr:ethanolamine ammonia-lyase small subunit [Stappia sp. 22II-S9-Z10]
MSEGDPKAAFPAAVVPDRWEALRELTPARIALGHTGVSLPTKHHLAFQMAHARAAKAVHEALDPDAFAALLAAKGWPAIALSSAVADRTEYLTRPDRGRRLSDESRAALSAVVSAEAPQLAFVVVDGLSRAAIEAHALPFLEAAMPMAADAGWTVGPIAVVRNGRVAVGDEVGEILGATITVVLIGERPGLSSPDSLGVYLTHGAKVGTTDEARNCISNVRGAGLPPADAAAKLFWLLKESFGRGFSGVALKDDAPVSQAIDGGGRNFLTGR